MCVLLCYCIILYICIYMQDSGLLLRKPWVRESDTKGKAVAFILIAGGLPQLILGSCLGFIISAFGTTRVVLVVALLGECFATVSALFLATKPTSHDRQWCWKPLVKCFQFLIHREARDNHDTFELLHQSQFNCHFFLCYCTLHLSGYFVRLAIVIGMQGSSFKGIKLCLCQPIKSMLIWPSLASPMIHGPHARLYSNSCKQMGGNEMVIQLCFVSCTL